TPNRRDGTREEWWQDTPLPLWGNGGMAIDLGEDGTTANAPSPRTGPHNLPNFPIVVATPDGRLRGGLGGSTPDTQYRLELSASSAPGLGGTGEAEDYLGSLEVTTDDQGQVVFDVPFSPPQDRPFVTATATDPDGNTSEISPLRRGLVAAP